MSNINDLASKAAARKAKRRAKVKNVLGKRSKGRDFSYLKLTDPDYSLKYTKALSEVNLELDAKELRKVVIDYLKTSGIKGNFSDISDYAFATAGKIIYIKTHGGAIAPETEKWLQSRISMLMDMRSDEVIDEVEKPKKKSVQDYIKDKTYELIAEIEGWIDDRDYGQKISTYMKENNIKAINNALIEEKYKRLTLEMQSVFKKNDSELVEAYKGVYTPEELKQFLAFLLTILKDTKTFVSQKISMRKPRAKKPVTPEKQVSKLKYKETGSIDPRKVIGAMQLWVFNTKTRKLGVYNAADPGGFKIKGSTLLNVDSNKSFCKTLRKPPEQLKELMTAGKVALRTFMEKIKGKNLPLKDRINKDTVLLRVM